MELVLQWGARRNERFTEMHLVITYEKNMIWYMSITLRVITPDPEQVPPPGYMQYK